MKHETTAKGSLKMNDNTTTPIIVLEIRHQLPPKAWVAIDGEAGVIDVARELHSDNHRYNIFTLEDLKSCYGEDDIPADALEIVKRDGQVGELNNDGFVRVDDLPSEFEWAIATRFHDLSSGSFYRSRAEVQDVLEYFPGFHQAELAKRALRKADEFVGDAWQNDDVN